MATDLAFCMVEKLGHAWPSVLMMKRESNWKVMEYTSELELFPEVLEGVEDAMGQLIP